MTPGTVAHEAPLSLGFSRQEYWSGLPCCPPGDLPNPGIKPRCPSLQTDSLPSGSTGKPKNTGVGSLFLLQEIFPIQWWNPSLLHCRFLNTERKVPPSSLSYCKRCQVLMGAENKLALDLRTSTRRLPCKWRWCHGILWWLILHVTLDCKNKLLVLAHCRVKSTFYLLRHRTLLISLSGLL